MCTGVCAVNTMLYSAGRKRGQPRKGAAFCNEAAVQYASTIERKCAEQKVWREREDKRYMGKYIEKERERNARDVREQNVTV